MNPNPDGKFSFGARSEFGGELTGWIAQSNPTTGVPAGASPAVGWIDINAGQLDGSQAMSLQAGSSVLNTTSTTWSSLNTGDQLTLTISLGMRDVSVLNWNEGTFFGLTDGTADFTTIALADTVGNSGLIANNPVTGTQSGNGNFTDVFFNYTVTGSETGNIGIFIYADGIGGTGPENQSFFDNVRLDVTAVPEPSVSLLGGLAALLLLRRRR